MSPIIIQILLPEIWMICRFDEVQTENREITEENAAHQGSTHKATNISTPKEFRTRSSIQNWEEGSDVEDHPDKSSDLHKRSTESLIGSQWFGAEKNTHNCSLPPALLLLRLPTG